MKLAMPAEKMEVEESLRLEIINHTVNLDKRLRKLYELIESDLLGSLVVSPNDIAPYRVRSPLPSTSRPQDRRILWTTVPAAHRARCLAICSRISGSKFWQVRCKGRGAKWHVWVMYLGGCG